MDQSGRKTQFVVCIKNDDYAASLEVRKIYTVIPDVRASGQHLLRIVDESGGDYLYPEDYFALIELPQTVVEALASAA